MSERDDVVLPNLHDAVLERIEVDWERGLMTLGVTRVPGGPARIVCHAIEEFEMTRRQEWGPSAFVNDAEVCRIGPGRAKLWIEMQSGDTISVLATRVDVELR
jgi:hypothetical protein